MSVTYYKEAIKLHLQMICVFMTIPIYKIHIGLYILLKQFYILFIKKQFKE